MKRRVGIAALCCLVGVVINVLVAWGITLCENPFARRSQAQPATALKWPTDVPTDWPDLPDHSDVASGLGSTYRYATWGTSLEDAPPGPAPLALQHEFIRRVRLGWVLVAVGEYGFPLRALRASSEQRTKPFTATSLHDRPWGQLARGLPVPKSIHAFGALPVDPLWAGLLVNSLIYAIVTWIVARLFVAWRRARRRRRGLCPRCAYDLAGLDTCPECGAKKT